MSAWYRLGVVAMGLLWPLVLSAQDTSPAPPSRDTEDPSVDVDTTSAPPTVSAPRPVDASPSSDDQAAIGQGTVTIQADDSSALRIYRDDQWVGSTPETVTQRANTKRLYRLKDAQGEQVCSDTVAVERPYQTVTVVCDSKTKRLRTGQ